MLQPTKVEKFDEEVIQVLEQQMLPRWERYGLEHLAASAATMQEFLAQQLPPSIGCYKKPRKSLKSTKQRRVVRSSPVIEEWPDDDQINVRVPILIYVRKGVAEVPLGDYVATCPAGHFLFLTPGVARPAGKKPHLDDPRRDKECEIWWFYSTGNDDFIALAVCYSMGEKHINSGHYYVVSDTRVVQLFHIFSQEIIDRSPHYEKACRSTFQAFLLLFLREIKANRFYNRGVDNLPKSAAVTASPIAMACQYIEKNLNHPLTIDIVAQAVFMAKTNFTQRFRQETGQTFREYLTERRLEEAKHWLQRESCSVDVVCKFVGLKKSRFHQLFLQRFGMTPIEFRQRAKQSDPPSE
jgi:AraC-like DNA-binding protein